MCIRDRTSSSNTPATCPSRNWQATHAHDGLANGVTHTVSESCFYGVWREDYFVRLIRQYRHILTSRSRLPSTTPLSNHAKTRPLRGFPSHSDRFCSDG